MNIKDYKKRYRQFYADIPKENQSKADELMERLASVAVLIDDCLEHIEKEGQVTEMPQGNYSITRENPYCKILDQKTKAYLSIMSQLDKLLPTEKQNGVNKAGEALAAFIAKGK